MQTEPAHPAAGGTPLDARLQTRVQRYGWDLAAADYEASWQAQLAGVQTALLDTARLAPGERVLDVACGSGRIALEAARRVGPQGRVLGVDLSGRMVEAAQQRLQDAPPAARVAFTRMDAAQLALADGAFDVALCSLGLMYLPDPAAALREMRRVLRPGGRLVLSVWGERARCGWAGLFEIVQAEVASEVCPLFFGLGGEGALQRLCSAVGLRTVSQQRLAATLVYADGDAACRAAFVGGPVALAWSRFSPSARRSACDTYLASLEGWRRGPGFAVPAEFVVVGAERLGTE